MTITVSISTQVYKIEIIIMIQVDLIIFLIQYDFLLY